jgi:hypothetical protein
MPWISPDSTNEDGYNWSGEDNIRDGDTETYARGYTVWQQELGTGINGNWATAKYLNSIRVLPGREHTTFYAMRVTIYDGGEWTAIFDDEPTWDAWNQIDFTPQNVTSVKVQFRRTQSPKETKWARVYEVQGQPAPKGAPGLHPGAILQVI